MVNTAMQPDGVAAIWECLWACTPLPSLGLAGACRNNKHNSLRGDGVHRTESVHRARDPCPDATADDVYSVKTQVLYCIFMKKH